MGLPHTKVGFKKLILIIVYPTLYKGAAKIKRGKLKMRADSVLSRAFRKNLKDFFRYSTQTFFGQDLTGRNFLSSN